MKNQAYIFACLILGIAIWLGYFDEFLVVTAADGTNWQVPHELGLGLIAIGFLLAIGNPFGHYSPKVDWARPTGTHIETVKEIVRRKVELEVKDELQACKCPVCSAPLKFNGSSSTVCEYCDTEVVKRKVG